MTDANSIRGSRASESGANGAKEGPKVVSFAEGREAKRGEDPSAQAPPPRPEEPRRGVSRDLFALVATLLALSLLGLAIQTQRVATRNEQIGLLTSRVEGLEVQLSAAHTQLASYEARLAQIRSSVSEIMERMGGLAELVNRDPLSPASSEPGPP